MKGNLLVDGDALEQAENKCLADQKIEGGKESAVNYIARNRIKSTQISPLCIFAKFILDASRKEN